MHYLQSQVLGSSFLPAEQARQRPPQHCSEAGHTLPAAPVVQPQAKLSLVHAPMHDPYLPAPLLHAPELVGKSFPSQLQSALAKQLK